MRIPVGGLVALGLLITAASCATAIPAETTATPAPGLAPIHENRRSARLDGLTHDASRADQPTGGAFYSDGEATIRTRVENKFDQPLAREAAPADRKMIYSASYTVMVAVVADAIATLLARTEAAGGYLAQRQDTSLTLRVPAAKFASFTASIPELGRVVSESMSANDVTDQHTDLSIRLENAEKARQRLLALLEKATKMEDILKIEEALRRLTGEIERMKGQLELLDNKIAYSTVTVQLRANAPQAVSGRQRPQSRFPWINRIGIEQDLRRFRP